MTVSQTNVVIIVLDTLRSQNVSCYGYPQPTSPNLDRIASEGVLFENAYANAPWTLPSHASMFTGRLPFDHGAHARNYQLLSSVPTLAGRLQENGYETTLISNNGWLSDGFGIVRGFENRYELWKLFQTETDIVEPYREHIKNTDLLHNPKSVVDFGVDVLRNGNPIRDATNMLYGMYHRDDRHHSGPRITNILRRVVRDPNGPFFVVANYLEPHLRYFPPEPYRSQFLPADVSEEEARNVCQDVYKVQFGGESLSDREQTILESLYNGEIAHADEYIGSVYDFLEKCGQLDDTYLFVVGDHGENIGDHGLLGHNSSLHDTVLKIPFIVRPPGGIDGRIETDPVQLTDMYQTVLEATDIAVKTDKIFSYDILGNGLEDRPNFAISQYAGLQLEVDRIETDYPEVDINEYDRTLTSVTDGIHRLVRDEMGKTELQKVPTDTLNEHSVSREISDRLMHILEEHSTPLDDSGRQSTEVGAAIQNRLKDLGYHK